MARTNSQTMLFTESEKKFIFTRQDAKQAVKLPPLKAPHRPLHEPHRFSIDEMFGLNKKTRTRKRRKIWRVIRVLGN